jgi:hypothetical protein
MGCPLKVPCELSRALPLCEGWEDAHDGAHDHHCKNEIQPKRDKPTEDARKRTSERGWRGKHEQQIKQCDDESKSQCHWMGSTCKVIPAICPLLRDAKRYGSLIKPQKRTTARTAKNSQRSPFISITATAYRMAADLVTVVNGRSRQRRVRCRQILWLAKHLEYFGLYARQSSATNVSLRSSANPSMRFRIIPYAEREIPASSSKIRVAIQRLP